MVTSNTVYWETVRLLLLRRVLEDSRTSNMAESTRTALNFEWGQDVSVILMWYTIISHSIQIQNVTSVTWPYFPMHDTGSDLCCGWVGLGRRRHEYNVTLYQWWGKYCYCYCIQVSLVPSQGSPFPSQGCPVPSQGSPVPSQGSLVPSQGSPVPRMYTEKQPSNLHQFKLYTDV